MLHADVESGGFGAWLVAHRRLHGGCRSRWGEVVLVDPGGEWFGEGSLVTAGVVEVVGSVEEGGGCGDPSFIRPGEVVVAGSPLTPAVCEVIDLVEKPVGTVVHLRVLPGTIDQYRRLLARVGV